MQIMQALWTVGPSKVAEVSALVDDDGGCATDRNRRTAASDEKLAEAQRQMAEAVRKLQSAEVQRQLRIVQSPEFKQRMADMQRQLEEATRKFDRSEAQRELRNSQQERDVPHVPPGQESPDLR